MWFEDPNMVIAVVIICVALGCTMVYFIRVLFEALK